MVAYGQGAGQWQGFASAVLFVTHSLIRPWMLLTAPFLPSLVRTGMRLAVIEMKGGLKLGSVPAGTTLNTRVEGVQSVTSTISFKATPTLVGHLN